MSLFVFALVVFVLVLVVGYLPFAHQFSNQPVLLHRMTALAAGFLIAAALLVALPEGFELFLHSAETNLLPGQTESDHQIQPAFFAGVAVLLGFLFMLMMEGLGFGHDVHEEHHDHSHDHGHDHVNHPEGSARTVVIGLSLHAIMDGVVIGAAYSLGELALSLQLAIVILMHKFPAAFSLSVYSLHERNNRKDSLVDLFLFALTTPVAVIVAAMFFSGLEPFYVGLMLLFSTGSFIYVATVDVLPDIHIREQSRETLWLVIAGILSMVTLSLFLLQLLPDSSHFH